GLFDNVSASIADLCFLHFDPEVGAFTSTLADASKYGVTAVGTRNTSDELGENNCFSQTGTAEQTGFTTADERREQVNNFNTRFEHFSLGRQVGHCRSIAVNGPIFFRLDRAAIVDRFAEQIEYTAQGRLADRHGHRAASVDDFHTADHAVSVAQGNAADAAAA